MEEKLKIAKKILPTVTNTANNTIESRKNFAKTTEVRRILNGRIAHIIETTGKVEYECYELPPINLVIDEVEKDVLSDPEFYDKFGIIFGSREDMETYVKNLTLEDLFNGRVS